MRDKERERERQRHRQREKRAPCREPNVGLDPGTPGSHPELKLVGLMARRFHQGTMLAPDRATTGAHGQCFACLMKQRCTPAVQDLSPSWLPPSFLNAC